MALTSYDHPSVRMSRAGTRKRACFDELKNHPSIKKSGAGVAEERGSAKLSDHLSIRTSRAGRAEEPWLTNSVPSFQQDVRTGCAEKTWL